MSVLVAEPQAIEATGIQVSASAMQPGMELLVGVRPYEVTWRQDNDSFIRFGAYSHLDEHEYVFLATPNQHYFLTVVDRNQNGSN